MNEGNVRRETCRALWLVLCLWIVSPAVGATLEQTSVAVQAKAALLVEASTGRVLYARNADSPLPPASTVKLMTALLAAERTGLGGSVRVQKIDTQVEPHRIPLTPGESVPVKELVGGLLVCSGNDAARALARHVAGSVPAFVAMMNNRAKELGCQRTNFCTPNGLPASGQLTTCRDLMKIFQAAISNHQLRDLASQKRQVIHSTVNNKVVTSTNRLLGVYPGMGPAKTGWTNASRHTYAAAVSQEGVELHLTLLGSPNKWKDAQLLFNYGFDRVLGRRSEPAAPEPRQQEVRRAIPVAKSSQKKVDPSSVDYSSAAFRQ